MTRRYLNQARVDELAQQLTDQERAIVSTLARVRIADADQLGRLHFRPDADRQRRRTLAKLVDLGVLTRLDRVIGGVRAGSLGFVYSLDVAGQRLADSANEQRRSRPWTPGLPFLEHSLEISGVYVRLVEAELAGRLELLDFTTEPRCWRAFTGRGGARLVLKPDAYVVIGAPEYEDRWFVEVDLGTESLPTIKRKFDLYTAYWQSGVEQAYSDGTFPRVLWLVRRESRLLALSQRHRLLPYNEQRLHAFALLSQAVGRFERGAA